MGSSVSLSSDDLSCLLAEVVSLSSRCFLRLDVGMGLSILSTVMLITPSL
jgi:hypothetical protein